MIPSTQFRFLNIDPDIASLDLDPIAYRLALDEGWTLDETDEAIAAYRVFLQAVRSHPAGLAPTTIMDKVWHQHILDTEKYIEDCRQLFGRYLHHFPYSGVMGEADAQAQDSRFANSLAIYDRIRNNTHLETSHA